MAHDLKDGHETVALRQSECEDEIRSHAALRRVARFPQVGKGIIVVPTAKGAPSSP